MSKLHKVSFRNREGELLSARLELPINQHPHSYALFAHCFTCSKNLSAVRNISRCLSMKGFGVLSFDFTGLGDSEGDFEETNFSSNVEDLIDAAGFLNREYETPQLIIGHSLGGAAVISAAQKVDSIKAVVTIGAPAAANHVNHLFSPALETIQKEGKAELNIGGRPFTIKKEFLDDLNEQNIKSKLNQLNKAFLVMHSPQDNIVGIENASAIYKAARHPKSFISLDGMDHLLSNREDSHYVGDLIASWAKRYIKESEPDPLKSQMEVAVRLSGGKYTTEIISGQHSMIADEPISVGGNDFGPSPYQFVSAGLGACTAMTLKMYANRKKWDLEEIIVHLNHGKVYTKDLELDLDGENTGKIDVFERVIEVEGNLNNKQRNRLLEIANRCPVHRTLESVAHIKTRLKDE